MPYIFAIGVVALARPVTAASLFSASLGLTTGQQALEAVDASGGSWGKSPVPSRMVAIEELGMAFPRPSGFAPGVFFDRMRFADGTNTFELFAFGGSFERLFPRLGMAGVRAGIGRASGTAAGDDWMTDLEVFMRVSLRVPGVYLAVSHQFLIGANTDVYQSTRIGVTVATPSINR
jgi:hypothetical protein